VVALLVLLPRCTILYWYPAQLMSMSMTMLVALMMFGPGSGARMKILQMQAMGPVAAKQEELQQRQEEEQQDSSVGGVTQVIEIK
jgi:hypothetical protein